MSRSAAGPTVGELCLVFLRHVDGHYVKNGKATSEIHILKSVIRPLNELYGNRYASSAIWSAVEMYTGRPAASRNVRR